MLVNSMYLGYNDQVRLDQAGAFCLSRQELYNSETLRGKALPLNSSVFSDALSSGLTPGDCIQWERFVMKTEKEEKKLWRDEEWLREQYLDRELGVAQVAKIAGCDRHTVSDWLREFSIPMRSVREVRRLQWKNRPYTNKEWLVHQYHEKGLSTTQMGRICSVEKGRIRKWMVKLGVPRRLSATYNPSSVELEVKETLSNMGIEYIQQYSPHDCSWIFDFFIPVCTLLEVNGTYWHAHPDFYDSDELNEAQRGRVERDRQVEEYVQSNNYELVTLWEHEISKHGGQAVIERDLLMMGGEHE